MVTINTDRRSTVMSHYLKCSVVSQSGSNLIIFAESSDSSCFFSLSMELSSTMKISIPSSDANNCYIDYSNQAAAQIAGCYPLFVVEIISECDASEQSQIVPSNVKGDGKLLPSRKPFVTNVVAIECAEQQVYWVSDLHRVSNPCSDRATTTKDAIDFPCFVLTRNAMLHHYCAEPSLPNRSCRSGRFHLPM